ncbi:hypothetical protein E4U14_005102 [Claviceps sp. LM454 group G7]|nr:hypothetical protein E4U14_005102 [Claviceps sp. LM454 group G7]
MLDRLDAMAHDQDGITGKGTYPGLAASGGAERMICEGHVASERSHIGAVMERQASRDLSSGGMSIINQMDVMDGKWQEPPFGQGKSGPSPTRRSAHSEFPKPIHLDAGYDKVDKVHDMG